MLLYNLFTSPITGYYIRTYPYIHNGEQKVGYVIYRTYKCLFCLCYERISICPDIEWLNAAKNILGI